MYMYVNLMFNCLFVCLFVCLSCGLASQSTVMVMSRRCLHFMELLPKIVVMKYNHLTKPIQLICMDGLT